MRLGEHKFSFYKSLLFDNALDFSGRSSFMKEIMLEKIYPTRIILPMKQHYGSPCIPVVKKGDHVLIGQCVGMPPEGSLGAPVHSGISGNVTDIRQIELPDTTKCEAVFISSDRKRTHHPSIRPRSDFNVSATNVTGMIKEAGIVGMGGEGIPTWAKITRARKSGVDCILVNCLQSEPYATSDLLRITDYADYLIMGAVALAGAVGVTTIEFLISEKKTTEITALQSAMERTQGRYSGYAFNIRYFKERFPQGYYRLVAKALWDKNLEPGQTLEETCKAVMFNCSTVYACWEAIADGMPLVSRIITVTGNDNDGHNVLAPIGTPVSEILNSINGRSETMDRIILGNALTGIALKDPDNIPVMKTTPAVTVIRDMEGVSSHCMHCGSCSRACPMEIYPSVLKQLIDRGMNEKAENEGIGKCIACGACSYVCPSRIDLTSTIAGYVASTAKRTPASFNSAVINESIDIGSVSLLERYNEEEEDKTSDDKDTILLPFEGGKRV